jgi:hypothetical protein
MPLSLSTERGWPRKAEIEAESFDSQKHSKPTRRKILPLRPCITTQKSLFKSLHQIGGELLASTGLSSRLDERRRRQDPAGTSLKLFLDQPVALFENQDNQVLIRKQDKCCPLSSFTGH